MTTPNQTSPDGAIVVGGGQWLYGQTVNEDIARANFELPMPTPENMLDLLRIVLESLPIDALQPFADFFGIVDGVFTNVAEAVEAILGSLGERFLPKFEEFLSGITNLDAWLVVFKNVIDFFKDLLTNVSANSLTILKELVDFLSDAFTGPGSIVTWLGELGSGVVSAVLTEFETFLSGITNRAAWLAVLKNVVDTFVSLTSSVGANLWTVVSGVITTFATLFASLNTSVWTVINQIITFFAGITAATRIAWLDVFKKLIDTIVGVAGLDNWLVVFKDVVNFFVGLIGSLDDAVFAIIQEIIEFFNGVRIGDGTVADWFRENVFSIPAGRLVGQIADNVLGLVNIGHLTDQPINLLSSPSFDTVSTVSPVDGWSWDSTQTATGSGGSAKVVCDGYNKELSHKTAVRVIAGNIMQLSAAVKTSGVTGTGWKASISVMEYRDGAIATPVEIASRTSNTSSWVTISGGYTVPANVSSVVFRLTVTDALSGTVWFDDLDIHKSGAIVQDWVDNLNTTWENIYTGTFGTSGAGKKWFDVGPAIATMTSNTSLAKQAGDNAQGNVQTTWNVLVDGFDKTTGSTGKTPADVRDRGQAVRVQADLGVSNASGVQGNVQSTWNALVDGFDNTSGSTGKTFNDVRDRGQALRQQANLGVSNAGDVATGIRRTLGGETGATGVPANTGTYLGNLITKMYGNGATVPLAAISNNAIVDLPFTRMSGSVSRGQITNGAVNTEKLDGAVVSDIKTQVFSSTVGSGAVIARINPQSSFAATSSTNQSFAGFFNTITRSTPDITAPTASYGGYSYYTSEFVVSLPGWYLCEVSFRVASPYAGGNYTITPILYKKPTPGTTEVFRYGTEIIGSMAGVTGSRSARYANSSWIVYLAAGESVLSGYSSGVIDGSPTQRLNFFSNNNTGYDNYFSIALLNRSLT